MAEQKGYLPVKGKPGNLSFYKTRDGYLIKPKLYELQPESR